MEKIIAVTITVVVLFIALCCFIGIGPIEMISSLFFCALFCCFRR